MDQDIHVFTVQNGKVIKVIPGHTYQRDSILFIPISKGSTEILKEQRQKLKLNRDLIKMKFKTATNRDI